MSIRSHALLLRGPPSPARDLYLSSPAPFHASFPPLFLRCPLGSFSLALHHSCNNSLFRSLFLLGRAFTSSATCRAYLHLQSPSSSSSDSMTGELLFVSLPSIPSHSSLAAMLHLVSSIRFHLVSPSLLTFYLITLTASGLSINFPAFSFVMSHSLSLFLYLCLVCP